MIIIIRLDAWLEKLGVTIRTRLLQKTGLVRHSWDASDGMNPDPMMRSVRVFEERAAERGFASLVKDAHKYMNTYYQRVSMRPTRWVHLTGITSCAGCVEKPQNALRTC